MCHLLVTSKGIATSHPNSTLFPKPSSLKSFKCLIIKVKVKWQLGKVGLDEWCRWLYKDHQSLFQQHLGWNCRMDHLNITFEVARGTFWLWNYNSFMCLGTKVDNISLLQVNTLRPLMWGGNNKCMDIFYKKKGFMQTSLRVIVLYGGIKTILYFSIQRYLKFP